MIDLATIREVYEGKHVTWRTWSGTARARIISISDQNVSILCGDGYNDYWPIYGMEHLERRLSGLTIVAEQ